MIIQANILFIIKAFGFFWRKKTARFETFGVSVRKMDSQNSPESPRAVDPKPPAPRTVSGSSVTSSTSKADTWFVVVEYMRPNAVGEMPMVDGGGDRIGREKVIPNVF